MNSDDVYWDELGIAWRTAEPDERQLKPVLESRLRRESVAMVAGLGGGIPLCLGGMALGIFTIWRGWRTETWNFITRGVGVELISVMLISALASYLGTVRSRGNARALSHMLDLAVARARKTLRLVRVVIAACVVAAGFGFVGVAIRTRHAAAPKLSPVIDVVFLTLVILAAWLYGRRVNHDRLKFEYLRRTLGR